MPCVAVQRMGGFLEWLPQSATTRKAHLACVLKTCMLELESVGTGTCASGSLPSACCGAVQLCVYARASSIAYLRSS